ncbi:DUF6011 domain-containing protein [Streptomyces sp. NPDC058612]|uniref:DUF6011 domain-containing protein n=1 Tax=Streptomyces sp. NPDC058612 TaxID=3346555 RepID=UPI00364D5A73
MTAPRETTVPVLPIGYYAIPDPDNPATMTYWRSTVDSVRMWPAKAWYGPPKPLKRDAPADRDERGEWLYAWYERQLAWRLAATTAIEAEPDACLARFAALTVRCCGCGRPLTDARSKTLGLGPDCRSGYDEAWLARTYTPLIAEAHAAQLTTR